MTGAVTSQATVALGQSGATVTPGEYDDMCKFGDARVVEQGRWLLHHGKKRGLVSVSQVYVDDTSDVNSGGGYRMERLCHLPIDVLDVDRLAVVIAETLSRDLWSCDAEVPIDWDTHREYVSTRVHTYVPQHHDAVMEWCDEVCRLDLRPVLIHGDPTFANTMLHYPAKHVYGREPEVVLIDPIPASDKMPSVRAVDIGKIMQSLLGYEVIRFGWPHRSIAPFQMLYELCDDVSEFTAALYFTAVHLVRLLPYTPSEYHVEIERALDDVIRYWRRTAQHGCGI